MRTICVQYKKIKLSLNLKYYIMASVYFLYRSTKQIAPLTVRLQLINDHEKKIQFQAKTQLEVSKKYWEKTRHKKRNVDAQDKKLISEINNELSKLEEFIITKLKLNSHDLEDKDMLKIIVHDYYNPPTTEIKRSDLILDCIQLIINSANTRENAHGQLGISPSRINGYKNLFNLFEKFQGNRKLMISDVDIKLGKEFLDWMINDCNYSDGYSRKKIDDLKTVCLDAEIHGSKTSSQLKKVKGGKTKNEHIIYLNPIELQKIKNLKLENIALINARKWLILGCSIGQRGGDLLNLTEKNFISRNGLEVIELKQQKTKKNVTIPVLKDVKEVIDEGLPYRIAMQNLNDLLKILSHKAGLTEMVFGSLVTMVDKEGKILVRDDKGEFPKGGRRRKVTGEFEKYKLISSHICRRSFATNYYGVIKTPWLIQITGHSTEKMFYNYIGKSPLDYAQDIAEFYNNQK